MILIWSGEGGPLQYLGLAIFFLQFFAPHLFHLTVDIQEGTLGIGNFPVTWIACSVAVSALVGGLWVILDYALEEEEDHDNNNDNVHNVDTNGNETAPAPPPATDDAADASVPSGSAANPVLIDDDINDEDDFLVRVRGRILSFVSSFSPTQLMLVLGFLLPLAMVAPLLWNGVHHSEGVSNFLASTGVLQVTLFAILAHSMMAIAAYRALRDVIDGEGVGPYPGNRRQQRLGRKLTVSEIADILRKVPVEEFVSEEDVRTGVCSVARMKRMLANRGAADIAEKCVEKDDLINEVLKVRKYNEECAICAEEYVEGDVLRVTRCQHEFHLHCFDKWIYTFSTDSRPATYPTCPLCKATVQ